MNENHKYSDVFSGLLTIFLLLGILTLSSANVPHAKASSDSIDSNVNLSESGRIDLSVTWREATPPNLKVSGGTWSMTLSSPETGKLKSKLDISIEFSKDGIQWLSEKKIMKLSLIDLLPIVDGYPSMVNNFLLDDWGGEVVSDVQWLALSLDLIPSSLSDKIGELTIESANCSSFSWDEPTMEIEVTVNFVGTPINNSSCVGRPSNEINGSLNVSDETWAKTANSQFNCSGTSDDWTWEFGIPHLQCLYSTQDYTDMKNQFSQKNVTLTINSVENADFSHAPEGFSKSGLDYEWTGTEAANALAALISGEGGYYISYPGGGQTDLPNDQISENLVDDNLDNISHPPSPVQYLV